MPGKLIIVAGYSSLAIQQFVEDIVCNSPKHFSVVTERNYGGTMDDLAGVIHTLKSGMCAYTSTGKLSPAPVIILGYPSGLSDERLRSYADIKIFIDCLPKMEGMCAEFEELLTTKKYADIVVSGRNSAVSNLLYRGFISYE